MSSYPQELGARLRAIRVQQGLSLHAVEERSRGRWKAVVIGSYERGDRAITAARLAELAEFYQVPLTRLLPEPQPRVATSPEPAPRLVIDLEQLSATTVREVAPLRRYLLAIQDRRGDYNGRVLTLRQDDLLAVAAVLDTPADELTSQLTHWGVLHQPGAANPAEPAS